MPGYRVNGYALDNYQNVFMVVFSQDLSSPPSYHAWDNTQTYPSVDTYGSTVLKRLFKSDDGLSNELRICLLDTSTAGASIKGSLTATTPTPGGGTRNRLLGTTNYVTATQTPVISGTSYPAGYDDTIRWNMVVEVPSDFEPSDDMQHLLEIKYTYTGTAPTLAWYYNAYSATQATNEASPSWQSWTPASAGGSEGIRHCSDGGQSTGPYWANIPYSTTEDTTEGWVTTADWTP